MKKETFRRRAFTANMIAGEIAMGATVTGLAVWGSTIATVLLGMDEKCPSIGAVCSGLIASIAASTVVASDKLQGIIVDAADASADNWTEIFYGLSDKEEVTED